MNERIRTLDEAMEQWSDGVIECRAGSQHVWRRLTVAHRPGLFTVKQRCPRCRNERERDMNEHGYWVSKWRRSYRPGYLLKGIGRLSEDDRATLNLVWLKNANIVEVTDE